ncbi:MAG TPA: hypothetical protein DCZ93_08185 [Elusimicrobia bacterium]|nr:hypothetical protein [Elusimicrobiota bacterium]
MSRKKFCAVSAAALCLAVPAAVWSLSRESAKALDCSDGSNPICGLYQLCRPLLDQYPEAEITEKGKDCALTVESLQITIRRKRVGDDSGYFFYTKMLPLKKTSSR